MDRIATPLTILLIGAAAGVAGYVTYSSSSGSNCCLISSLTSSQSVTNSVPSSDSDALCPLCVAAQQKESCCSGESSAKLAAFTAKTGETAPSEPTCCQELATAQMHVAYLVGSVAHAASTGGCCSEGCGQSKETTPTAASSGTGSAAAGAAEAK